MRARDEEKVRHSLTAGGPWRRGEVMNGLRALWPGGLLEMKP